MRSRSHTVDAVPPFRPLANPIRDPARKSFPYHGFSARSRRWFGTLTFASEGAGAGLGWGARHGEMGDELALRRVPKQRRSREIVDAIVEAGRQLLAESGPEALTTNAVAERAGVSIGSLYRYFPHRAAVLAAIYDRDATREAADLAEEESWPLEALSLEDALAALVDFQLERHRRLLGMEEDFYRDHHGEFSLAGRLGADDVVARIRALLTSHASRLRVGDLDAAAFLVARGVSAIVRQTLAERPEQLDEPAFRRELVDLMVRYVVADGS